MYARVVTSQVPPGRMDEAIGIYSDVMSGAREKGFKGALLPTDQANGKSISITLWEAEADMLATEEIGWWQQQVARFGDVFSGPPMREHYEVSFEAWRSSPQAGGEHQPSDPLRRIFLHRRNGVRVGIERDRDRGVAEPL